MKQIKQIFQELWDAWVEARTQQAKYYHGHSHIE
jgi:hypothetical protein